MKNVKWIFVVLVLSSFTSLLTSFVGKDKPTGGLNVGSVAPDFRIEATQAEQPQTVTQLRELRGRYVLLSFWASYDAASRMQNVSLSNALRTAARKDVEMVSVSCDTYSSIFEETVRKDRIVAANCFVDTDGERSSLFKTYRLKRGFGNYLLDERGVIIAKNVSAEELKSYLN